MNHLTSIAIVFITGNDDRETLALSIRMTGHPKLKVTLIRVVIVGWECKSNEEKAEKKLDNLLVHQFVAERGTKERVGYHQFAAEKLQQVMQWMRGLGWGYDLIIVGRKRWGTTDSMDEDTMLSSRQSQIPELGVLGDQIASAEYLWDGVGNTALWRLLVKAKNHLKEDDAIHLLKSQFLR